jgi:phosphomannomutase
MSEPTARERGLRRDLGEELVSRYLEGIRRMPLHPGVARDLRIAYTALHGVGEKLVRRALEQTGFLNLYSVAEQAAPDMDFPTAADPNPEQEGTMAMVLDLGRRVKADLVIASDPDADRMALAAPGRGGELVRLTGNQTGVLLAHYLLGQGESGGQRLVVSSIASTPLVEDIARYHGARWEGTLTGFKWICNRAMEIERETGARFVFGFEEALGYTAGTLVRDKDGISSAVLAADLAAWCKHRGRTLHDELRETERLYGTVCERSLSFAVEGPEGGKMREGIMRRLRASFPERIGEHRVEAVSDFLERIRKGRDGTREPVGLPRSDVLAVEMEGGHRVVVRPSGTEPKLKLYLYARMPRQAGEGGLPSAVGESLLLQELVAAVLRWLGEGVR